MSSDELRDKVNRAMTDLQRGYRQKIELARQLQDAAAARGETVSGAAILTAIDEVIREQEAVERAGELERARWALGVAEPGVERRKPGRPPWTRQAFHAAYREARDRAGGPMAGDKTLAAEMSIGPQQLGRLVRRYGRPT
ncbi:MAG TPA: hypothetical protein VIK08_09055 [Candidatus Limnocylindrales bacterium]